MILIVDDDKSIRLSLGMLLKRAGYDTVTAASPDEALDVLRSSDPQLVIMDMNYSRSTTGTEGIELLRKCRILRPGSPVMLITAWGSIDLAVEGMRAGAFDFITKPWSNHILLSRVATAVKLFGSGLTPTDSGQFDRRGIIGESSELLSLLDTAARVAPTDAPVLILGENGTGKEMVAQAIHANSRRAHRNFVMVNLGGISQSLFESEMFGHVKGAFTGAVADRKGRFEMADGGTIFLDEIGELDPASQVKMLRVLQEHTFEALGDSRPRRADIRVVSATNADLAAMVAERLFREDLFYRINLITLRMPPLRERRTDIPLLVQHFASNASGAAAPRITSAALDWLSRQPWPGNIRQLRNLVERTIIVSGSQVLDTSHFAEALNLDPSGTAATKASATDGTLEALERASITDALARADGNLTRAAQLLGLTRQSLYRRMAKYDIHP